MNVDTAAAIIPYRGTNIRFKTMLQAAATTTEIVTRCPFLYA